MSWKYLEPTLLFYSNNIDNTKKYDKIAMFDLDFTLVKPIGKRIFPKNVDDWEWMFKDNIVKNKLNELYNEKYLLYIISNQSGLSNNRNFLLDRITNILINLKIPIEVYVSCDNDKYRKPNTTIFENYILQKLENNFTDLFYVGDAAGRKEDFSDSDRKFAYNIHLLLKYLNKPNIIKFYTPEEFFLKSKCSKKEWQGFNPIEYIKTNKSLLNKKESELFNILNEHLKEQKVIILIGPPASGKSTISKYILKTYENMVHINQDKCITKNKCFNKFKNTLQNGQSVILDNTNPSKKIRNEYIKEAFNINPYIYIYFIHMNTFNNKQKNRNLYEHLNVYRERIENIKKIPNIAYNIFYKNYEIPENSEIPEKNIIQIPFIPKFKDKNQLLRFIQKS